MKVTMIMLALMLPLASAYAVSDEEFNRPENIRARMNHTADENGLARKGPAPSAPHTQQDSRTEAERMGYTKEYLESHGARSYGDLKSRQESEGQARRQLIQQAEQAKQQQVEAERQREFAAQQQQAREEAENARFRRLERAIDNSGGGSWHGHCTSDGAGGMNC